MALYCRLRLVSVAAQHFVAAVLDEAINLGKRRRMAPAQHLRNEGHNPRDRRQILSSEDLGEALQEVRRGLWGLRAWLMGRRSAKRARS